tara:strand:- start:593 stop:742 length:150 start_codon:yes stop_codon:yes gene_type:complete
MTAKKGYPLVAFAYQKKIPKNLHKELRRLGRKKFLKRWKESKLFKRKQL